MNRRSKMMPFMIVAFSGCAVLSHNFPARPPATAVANVILSVINAADNSTGVPGVEIAIVEANGTQRTLGQTDTWGRVTLSADVLDRSQVILVCHPLFYCGALRREDFIGFRERTIAIAPLVLR